MDNVKKHFEEEAQAFDRIVVTLIPGYARMLEALVAALPFERSAPLRVIDLGCGTGTVAERRPGGLSQRPTHLSRFGPKHDRHGAG